MPKSKKAMSNGGKKNKSRKEPNNSADLARFISREFGLVEARFDNLEKMFSGLQGAVDSYAKKADSYFQEMVFLSRQFDRHEKWIRKIAEKVGVKLED